MDSSSSINQIQPLLCRKAVQLLIYSYNTSLIIVHLIKKNIASKITQKYTIKVTSRKIQ